jgi:hypothetical protein
LQPDLSNLRIDLIDLKSTADSDQNYPPINNFIVAGIVDTFKIIDFEY